MDQLRDFGALLIDQQRARVIVPPQQPKSGFWFGGGNMAQDGSGSLWLVGRYRNHGDSRTGIEAGTRGLELAIFRSDDQGKSFAKVKSFSKADLNVGPREVLSIEGSAIRFTERGVELFVSTEKTGIEYPVGLESFLKPGTGVWTIDRMVANDVASLSGEQIETVVQSSDPTVIQIKDPFFGSHRGQDCLLFCTHPFCWSSSNSAYVPLGSDGLPSGECEFGFFPRGFAWDVAMTRATAMLPLPERHFDEGQSLMFYDGGECLRDLDEHSAAVKRPRGYSCEELGGLAVVGNNDLHSIQRVSRLQPMFLSPWGTGCSRYVDVLETADGYYATWQQSQSDRSQPLVMNFVSHDEVDALLAKH